MARGAALLGLVLLTSVLSAAPSVADGEGENEGVHLYASGSATADGADCTISETASPDPDVEVVANGPVAVVQRSSAATTTFTPEPADTTSSSSSVSASARMSTLGPSLDSIDFAALGAAELSRAERPSSCETDQWAVAGLTYVFPVGQDGFLTVTIKNRGALATRVDLAPADVKSEPVFTTGAALLKTDLTATVFLPAGSYRGQLASSIGVFGDTSAAASGTSAVHASFAVAGTRSTPVQGPGMRFVRLPEERSCSGHSFVTSITEKRARARDIKRVGFFVGGVRVLKVNRPRRGQVVAVPVADEAGDGLRVVVALRRGPDGRPGKVLEATADYVPCS